MEVLEECRSNGVNEFYVSGLICRPKYQDKINAINNLLRSNCIKYDYYCINNSNIKPHHLWSDDLHLDTDIYLLSQNLTEYVNSVFTYNSQWV